MLKDIFKGEAGKKIKGIFPCLDVLDDFGAGVAFISPQMEIIAFNKITKKMFPHIDVSKKPICYKSFNIPPRDEICTYCPTIKALTDGKVHEAITNTPQGDKIVNYRVVASPLKDSSGNIIAAIEIVEDVTERKKLEEQIKVSEEKYRKLFEEANDAIFIADQETGQLLDANKQAERLIGRTKEEICRMHQSQLHPQEEAEHYKEIFRRHAKEGRASNFEAEVINKEGRRTPIFISASKQLIGSKKIIQGIFRDVSELKKIEAEKKEAETLALIDPHTQLYNYRYLQRRLHAEFEAAKRHLTPLSLMFIDIDYFESVNDTYGHEFGDGVLKEFASLLERSCREIDIVTRFGGEEFIIIFPDTDCKGTLSFARRIQDTINKRQFGDYKVRLKISIGIASYPEDGMKTSDALLTCSEKGVRIAKEKGGNAIYNCRDIKGKKLEPSIIEDISKRRVNGIRKKFIDLAKMANKNIIEAVYALAHAVGARDAYTEEHSEDMVFYATEIGKRLNLSEEELEDLKHGAMLHDIGKIGISDNILLKKGKLTKKEFEAVKKHPQIGADIIRSVHFLKNVVPIILHHHERFDGYGYGSELRGEEIPLGGRIIGLVDAYQALTSNRPYRKACLKKEAIEIIKEESGRHFDPKIVKVFLEILTKKERGR